MKYDFGGYATKNDVRCIDGRIIKQNAFESQNGSKIPLVYQHDHNDPMNIIGHGILENRPDGVYLHGTFNDTERGKHMKACVAHGDVDSLSIWANQIQEVGKNVIHGVIREVSLVLSGANPGAVIDNPVIVHGDVEDIIFDEAIIYPGFKIESGADTEISLSHSEDLDKKEDKPKKDDNSDDETVKDVYDSMTDKQKQVVAYMVGEALASTSKNEDDTKDEKVKHSNMEDDEMKNNVFDQNAMNDNVSKALSHDSMKAIFDDAKKSNSLRDVVIAHAATYGIDNIDILFPDAKTVNTQPELIKRRTEWVNMVISGARHTPFSRIRSTQVDITADEARARGYIKGKKKVDEVIKAMKRVTTPQTIYKKQKLDRDDIIDITDFDVVAFLRGEMRLMLDEELARAALIGDGRSISDESHISEDHIRPIYTDDDLYTIRYQLASNASEADKMDAFTYAMLDYEGSGMPVAFMAPMTRAKMLLQKKTDGSRLYANETELTTALGVSKIIPVPLFTNVNRSVTSGEGASATTKTYDLVAIVVNMSDYTFGADRGGEVNTFDDFDIDYNQMKYLIETRCSGALIKPKSAVVIEMEKAAG